MTDDQVRGHARHWADVLWHATQGKETLDSMLRIAKFSKYQMAYGDAWGDEVKSQLKVRANA